MDPVMHHSKTWTSLRTMFILLLSAATILIGACGSSPVRPPIPFRAIALIPVASPQSIYVENRRLPLPLPLSIASSIANRGKDAEFSRRMDAARKELGPRFTRMLMEELQAQGFNVQTLEGFARSTTDPDNIAYAKLPTKDAVLHVWFNDVSMDSPRTSSDYLPRVNVDATFYPEPSRPDDGQSLYYRYGTDANGSKPWSIPASDKYRYPNFDALIANSDDVAESWTVGLREMAKRIARDLPRAN